MTFRSCQKNKTAVAVTAQSSCAALAPKQFVMTACHRKTEENTVGSHCSAFCEFQQQIFSTKKFWTFFFVYNALSVNRPILSF